MQTRRQKRGEVKISKQGHRNDKDGEKLNTEEREGKA